MSTAAYPAFGTASENRLQIADPLIKTLNQNAAGANIEVSSSGVIGMPKVSYGLANGKLLLRTTTAPTIGSFTGTGSVGTGTALGSIGTGGNGLGVNGKNPDAGPALYGVPVYGTTVIRNKTDLKQ